MRQWMGIGAALLTVLAATRAAGQTTQPAPETWGQTVQAVASALVHEDPATVLGGIISEDITLRELNSSRLETRQSLTRRIEGMRVISARAYVWSATTIATDLASDIKACDSIPPALRDPFIPRDAAGARKANAVAQQWVASILEPTEKDLIAVLMLWEPPPTATSILLTTNPAPEPKLPLFLFIKGKQTDFGEVQITSISFGDAKQALK